MNKALKKKWVNALRSGEYKQGQGELRTPYGEYCCLGVLVDVSGGRIKDGQGMPSPSQCRRLGIPFAADIYSSEPDKSDTITEKLACYNDKGKSFKWIASYIERYL